MRTEQPYPRFKQEELEVEGQGIEEAFETNLSPGETQTIQLNLEPGTYEVYCLVGNHREQGMEMQLTALSEDSSLSLGSI